MPNALENEKSLYLQQHKDNPVKWLPWGSEALKIAQDKGLPVLVSIGYSSCHWCHVMAHESFEDPYIGSLMNEHFVCIKVDREEYPAIDALYMEAVQMITGRGGWPLNVFCLPDGRPFFGGTYFPAKDHGWGIVPWPQLLMRVADHFRRSRADLEENAANILRNIEHLSTPEDAGGNVSREMLLSAADRLLKAHDDVNGGFGQAPKFPCGLYLGFLMTAQTLSQDLSFQERVRFVVDKSLTAMAFGGLYDQIGGGFMRYAVDAKWEKPHFEKMLYDNAIALKTYARGYAFSKNPLFLTIAEEIAQFIHSTFKASDGTLRTAQDADSPEGEGRFYFWEKSQLAKILTPEELKRFLHFYGPQDPAKAELPFYPIFRGTWDDRVSLSGIRQKIVAARSERVQPVVDTKTSLWSNALWVSALMYAGVYAGKMDFMQQAEDLLEQLIKTFWKDENLYAVAYEGNVSGIPAVLSDAAALAEALWTAASFMDIIHPGKSASYKAKGKKLLDWIEKAFGDEVAVGYFKTSNVSTCDIKRRKIWLDQSYPTGQSLLLRALGLASVMEPSNIYVERFLKLRSAFSGLATKAPQAIASVLEILSAYESGIGHLSFQEKASDEVVSILSSFSEKWMTTEALSTEQLAKKYRLCHKGCCLPAMDTDIEVRKFLKDFS